MQDYLRLFVTFIVVQRSKGLVRNMYVSSFFVAANGKITVYITITTRRLRNVCILSSTTSTPLPTRGHLTFYLAGRTLVIREHTQLT